MSWCWWLSAIEDVGFQAFAFRSLDDVGFHDFVKPLIEKLAGASEIMELVVFEAAKSQSHPLPDVCSTPEARDQPLTGSPQGLVVVACDPQRCSRVGIFKGSSVSIIECVKIVRG